MKYKYMQKSVNENAQGVRQANIIVLNNAGLYNYLGQSIIIFVGRLSYMTSSLPSFDSSDIFTFDV